MKKLSMAVLLVGALCAFGGGVAPSASANICAISTESKGNYGKRTPDTAAGACELPGTVGSKKYIVVRDKGRRIGTEVACAEVAEALTGNFSDPDCTTNVGAGNGSFVKIKVAPGNFRRWWVAGKDAKELPAAVQITKLTSAKATLKSKIGGAEVKFTTSSAPELIGFKLEAEGKLTAGGAVKFTGVTTELNGKTSSVCTPLGTVGNDATLGIITSVKGKGDLVLYEGSAGTEMLPIMENVIARLSFGEECSLPAEVPVITKKETGKALVLTDPLGIGNELAEHEITELSALTELWVISETAEHKATVEGKAAVGLTGAHIGLKWKGTPDEIEVS